MHTVLQEYQRLRINHPQPFLRTSAGTAFCRTLRWGRIWLLLGVAIQIVTSSSARAMHPISVTEARVFVTKNSARARIQLFAEDLLLFHELEPDGEGRLSPAELERGLQLHKAFLTERVTIRDAEGNLIPSRVTDLESFEIPEDGIPEEDLMLYQATYELEFPFETPPEYLTFQQDITDENFILPSEMKLAIHQTGSGNVIAGTLQPSESVTHRFDWEAPLDPKASDEEYESWLEKQRNDTLGITSYSSVYSFIYVEPGEVRHEVLIPLANLATILPIERADPAFLEIPEQGAARKLIQEWLADRNPAQINGQDVKAEFSRIDFYGLSLRDFAQQADARRVSFASGRVGIILRYLPPDGFVQSVDLTWDTFQSSMRKIRSVIMPWDGEIERFEFSRFKKNEDNIFHWQADAELIPQLADTVPRKLPDAPKMRIPVVSCVLAALALFVPLVTKRRWQTFLGLLTLAIVSWPVAGIQVAHPFKEIPQLSLSECRSIAEQLHSGTYHAMDFGSEQRIYEALQRFVDGKLLEPLYLQLRDGLAVREQGGAVARVQSVEYLEGSLADDQWNGLDWPGFQFRTTWEVAGTVEHWGHVHERRNQFSAVLNIESLDGLWKITDMQIDSQKSLSGATRLREF